MGIGDALIAAGDARRAHAQTGLPVVIVGRRGQPTWSEMWQGVPYILHRHRPNGQAHTRVVNGTGVRPYIAEKTPRRWTWRAYGPTPAEIVLTPAERQYGAPYAGMVMIEPNGKDIGHTNKQWLRERWEALPTAMPGVRFVQCAPVGGSWLPGVERVTTPTFRHACAVMAGARAFVGTEGGLMHAAAALGTPAVILWSEFIDPPVTGYAALSNLRHAGEPCGMRVDCPGCRASMEAIGTDEVVAALRALL